MEKDKKTDTSPAENNNNEVEPTLFEFVRSLFEGQNTLKRRH